MKALTSSSAAAELFTGTAMNRSAILEKYIARLASLGEVQDLSASSLRLVTTAPSVVAPLLPTGLRSGLRCPAYLPVELRARRKPRRSLRNEGSTLSRFADRQSLAELSHLPPRKTRNAASDFCSGSTPPISLAS